jgi:hypothetical protein
MHACLAPVLLQGQGRCKTGTALEPARTQDVAQDTSARASAGTGAPEQLVSVGITGNIGAEVSPIYAVFYIASSWPWFDACGQLDCACFLVGLPAMPALARAGMPAECLQGLRRAWPVDCCANYN